ncbi:shikimate dehydrogenase [Caenispirillum bisanense]|uniref:Shikimate dehydrogenase (NADP(+)) n=2 Tax=Caenispirillum bisanense TaxID=414052 RepID=A0A286GUV4_9PROT|nr:shikimate dehydrogenase [Caenispirillum bisanense]
MMLSGKARVAGVMGWPVSHSRSPRLHGFWLREHGIDGAYVPLPVRPEDFAAAVRALPKLGFAGANVTVPHKEAALAACDEVSPLARRIGAVNTLVCRPDGSLWGDNTDGFGFLENLRAGCPGWRPEAGPAVVLGAGGAARAVVAALLDAGCPQVRLTNRTRDRAAELAADLGGAIEVVAWEERRAALAGAGLLVNTTTLGMTGAPPLDLALDPLPAAALVTDIVYAPLVTDLLARAQARGNAVVDGLGMLLHQGRPGFEAWFGVRPEVTPALRAAVLGDAPA